MTQEIRAGGMLRERKTFAIVFAPVFFLFLVARVNAIPLQYLPDIPGYIPVYIRYGDQPLEEINPELAEAFHERTGVLNRIQEISLDHLPLDHGNSNKDLIDKKDSSLNSKKENISYKNDNLSLNQLISIIPQEKYSSLRKSKSPEQKFIMTKLSKFLPLKKSNV